MDGTLFHNLIMELVYVGLFGQKEKNASRIDFTLKAA